MKLRFSIVLALSLTTLPHTVFAGGFTMAPDGSYVGGYSYQMAPDGSYVGQ